MYTKERGDVRSLLYYGFIGLFCIAYTILSLTQPVQPTSARFELSSSEVALLRISIAAFLSLIWFLGCYAALTFYRYAYKVREGEERGYLLISYGLWILLANLVLSTFISLARTRFENWNADVETVRRFFGIFTTYSQVLLYFVGFLLIYMGSRRLLQILPALPERFKERWLGVSLLVLGIGILYIGFIFQNPYRFTSDSTTVSPTYYVSDVLILTTVAIPYIATWFVGALATLTIFVFRRRVQGIIYRRMLHYFAIGVTLVIFSTILLQFLRQFPLFFARLTLGWILIVLYGLIALIVCGYLLIASSAKRLAKIEHT